MEDQEVTKEQADDFNAGYLLQQYEPELLNGILKSNDGKSAYLNTLAKGKQQQEREKIIQQQRRNSEKRKEKRPRR